MKSEERRAGATTADAGADSGGDGSCDELESGIAVGGGDGLRSSSRSDEDVMRGDVVCLGVDEGKEGSSPGVATRCR